MPPNPRSSRKRRLREYLAARNPAIIGEAEWRELLEQLAPVTESYLRRLLRETETPVQQPFAGVRQKSFDELEQSLIEMERIYSEAIQAGDRERARYCRNVVIHARDRARMVARNSNAPPETKARKREMAGWMLVWLENPGVFPIWVRLRKMRLATEAR